MPSLTCGSRAALLAQSAPMPDWTPGCKSACGAHRESGGRPSGRKPRQPGAWPRRAAAQQRPTPFYEKVPEARYEKVPKARTNVALHVALVHEAALGSFGQDTVAQHHAVQVLRHLALRVHLRWQTGMRHNAKWNDQFGVSYPRPCCPVAATSCPPSTLWVGTIVLTRYQYCVLMCLFRMICGVTFVGVARCCPGITTALPSVSIEQATHAAICQTAIAAQKRVVPDLATP